MCMTLTVLPLSKRQLTFVIYLVKDALNDAMVGLSNKAEAVHSLCEMTFVDDQHFFQNRLFSYTNYTTFSRVGHWERGQKEKRQR